MEVTVKMTTLEKRICDEKLDLLCSPMVKGSVVGWCKGLSGEQKTHILNRLLNELCKSLHVRAEEVINGTFTH